MEARWLRSPGVARNVRVIYNFWQIWKIVTLLPSHFVKLSRFHPHICQNCYDFTLTICQSPYMLILNIPDNNNPMQRICEEKARDHCIGCWLRSANECGGNCVNGGQVAAESRGVPKCEGNLQFLTKAKKCHAFTLTICQSVTISPSHLSKVSRFHPHNLSIPLYVNFKYPR